MRLALITIPGLYGAYFAREIQARFPGAECVIICQRAPTGPVTRAQRMTSAPDAGGPGVPGLIQRLRAGVHKVYWKAYEIVHLRINPLTADTIWKRRNVTVTTDVNDPANVERLAAFGPDFILIFGGRIVQPPILQTARRAALNVHGGKLPEYRGANGIKWMLWNGDIDRVCATVHVAAPKVDAGEIIREASVDVQPGDTYRTIFTRLHVAGVRAMIAAVEDLVAGRANPRPQAGTPRTYRAREWTPEHESLLDRRLELTTRDRRLSTLPRRIAFHAYRRLHRITPGAFSPRPGGSVALLYHNVAPEESAYVARLGVTITPEHFEEHVRYLVRNFDVVPFSGLEARRGDRRAVALTFDDGFASIASTVLPIIERHGCPIKLYICESIVDGGLLWLNKLSVVLSSLSGAALETFLDAALDRSPADPRRDPIVEVIECFDPSRTLRVLDEYYARLHPGSAPRLYLNEEEIRRLLDHPLVEIGSHTRLHLPQHRLSDDARRDEITRAHRDLVSRFDDRIRGFALPFGYRRHFTPGVVADIRQIDDAVVSAYGGYADTALIHGEPEVRRIGVWGNLGTLWYQMARAG